MEKLSVSKIFHDHPRLEIWGVRLPALLTAGMGILNLVSAVSPALHPRIPLYEELPLAVHYGSRVTSALAGFGLLLLATGLWRRKRTSWSLSVFLVSVSILAGMAKRSNFEDAIPGFGLLGLLILLRKSFHAHTDRPSLRQGLLVLAGAFLFTLVYGTMGFYLLDQHFHVRFSLPTAVQQTIMMFTSFYNPGVEPVTGFGVYFIFSIYLVGFSTLAYALLMLIRPVLVREPATAVERKKAADIVEHFGRTALARPALFDDKSYFFSPGGSVIAYAARGRGVMALGDPIGPSEDAPAVISAFREVCADNDWIPAFASVLPDYLDAYRASGYDAVSIGREAIVDLRGFALDRHELKDVRYEYNRLVRRGFHAEICEPPLDDKLLRDLRAISDSWLTLQHGGEMHFSVGWFDDEYIRNGIAVVVRSPDGSNIAFSNLVPEYRKNEITIDLMRHFPNVEHGTMEFLFASMLLWAKDRGFETFSLGLSALIGVGEKQDDPRVEQALHTIAVAVGRFYNFRGLHAFKEKFRPRWESRYLVFPGPASLPVVLTTLLRVHSGDDFLWKYLFG
jgi:phosphatidylglycerol lysyltransferase